jgi:FMN phosphatase YigB (HAD superfamily)
MQKILLFDIDHTLIDTNKLKIIQLAELFKISGLRKEYFDKIKNGYIKSLASPIDFSPEDLSTVLSRSSGKNKAQFLSVFYSSPKVYRESLFAETFIVLESLQKNYSLGIFSEGKVTFQKIKLKHSGISKFFNPLYVYIFPRKTTDEIFYALPDEAIIVDDNIKKLEFLLKRPLIKSVWLNRKSKTKHKIIPTIHTLEELIKIFSS